MHAFANDTAPDLSPGLDALAAQGLTALRARYDSAPAPRSLDPLDGAPRGRMLAVRHAGALSGALRRVAGVERFPWRGKSFSTAPGARQGRGINRVRLGGVHNLFGFTTRIGPSALDGGDCVVLDYEQPQNPSLIQRIHDEIREIAPGLWLGPAMWKTDSGPRLVLWFALDFTTMDPLEAFGFGG